VTGKPLDIGGSLGRNEATARGCLFAVQRALARGAVPGLNRLDAARVVIQGFGNAGSIAARLFHEAGARIVAVSDSRGGIQCEEGLDVDAVVQHKGTEGTVIGCPGTRTLSNDELLALDCDLLIPAALEAQIREDNAPRVRARFICEAANGPTTPAADRILFERGIPVLPDILANSGGVCVSYFEWVQNIENEQWDLDTVNQKLRVKIERAVDAVLDKQKDIGHPKANAKKASKRREAVEPAGESRLADLRTAALAVAIDRVATVTLERGIWP
jgi:glutamate dehydrogenase/leucine dehydrogenase